MPKKTIEYWFKVEAVNFESTALDTSDLSIARGASLTMLNMPELLAKYLQSKFQDTEHSLEIIASAASNLLFRVFFTVEVNSLPSAQKIEKPSALPKSLQKKWRRDVIQPSIDAIKAEGDSLTLMTLEAIAEEKLKAFLSSHASFTDALMAQAIAQILGVVGNSTRQILEGGASGSSFAWPVLESIDRFLSSETTVQMADGVGVQYPFDLFCFIAVDHQRLESEGSAQVINTLSNKVRMQQLKKWTIPPMPTGEKFIDGNDGENTLCAFTQTLPSARNADGKPLVVKRKPASRSAMLRHEVGRLSKHLFYQKQLPDHLSFDQPELGKIEGFARNFEDIIENPPDGTPVSVRGKVAVLNFDGNNFNRKLAALLKNKGLKDYQLYSQELERYKQAMLGTVLTKIAQTPAMIEPVKNDKTGVYEDIAKFETLLWGGDEFTFVCPAWFGWTLLNTVFKAVDSWKGPDGEPLTVKAGLVFAPHNAPISNLISAAEDLADCAKGNGEKNQVQAIAYESVDRIHFEPERFRSTWLRRAKFPENAFSIDNEKVKAAAANYQNFRAKAGKSQLHHWFDRFSSQSPDQNDANRVWLNEEIARVIGQEPKPFLDQMNGVFGAASADDDMLVTLAQLLLLGDYVECQPSLEREGV